MEEPTKKGAISPADWIKAIAAIAGLPLALYALVNAIAAAAPLVTLFVALAAAVLASIYLAHFQRVETVVVVIAWLIFGVLLSVTVKGVIRDTAGAPASRVVIEAMAAANQAQERGEKKNDDAEWRQIVLDYAVRSAVREVADLHQRRYSSLG